MTAPEKRQSILKKIGGYTALLGAVGVLWSAAQWCQRTSDKQDQQSTKEDAIVQQLREMRQDNAKIGSANTFNSRRIETLDNNQKLMNRYVRAPQIPMPQPDMVKQQPQVKEDRSTVNDPFLAKDKPQSAEINVWPTSSTY